MKQKVIQLCTLALLTLVSSSAQAQDVEQWLRDDGVPNVKARSVILAGYTMTAGAPLAALMLDVKRISNLEKRAKNAAEAGKLAEARSLEAKVAKGKSTRFTPIRIAGAVAGAAIFYETAKFEVMLDPRMVEIEHKKELINQLLEKDGLPPVTAADVSAR